MSDQQSRVSMLSQAPFYVGYLPMPPSLVAFLFLIVPSVLAVLAFTAIAAARSQRDPGAAVWNDAHARQFRGLFGAHPYPMLLIQKDGEETPEIHLLVEMGKHAGRIGLAELNGKSVIASGWTLERDGRRMIELEPDAKALVADASPSAVPPLPPVVTTGRVTLHGEIVDSKCYLGAMKPGEGKTHKACATLCIRGGIPPVLVTRDEAGGRVYYLLVDPSGGPLDPAAWPFIGDPVALSGELELMGGMRLLKVSPRDISRR